MSFNEEYDYLFKIMLIGDSGVGKSSLMMRICDEKFNPTFFPTIGVDFKIKTFTEESIKLQIWDTAGQERFKAITNAYYRGANGIIVVFDVANRQSFNNVENWLIDIENLKTKNVIRLLVGNKCDLNDEREVSQDEAARFAENSGMKYIETSAKNDTNVQNAMKSLNEEMKKEFINVNKLQKQKDKKIQIEKTLKVAEKLTNGCKC